MLQFQLKGKPQLPSTLEKTFNLPTSTGRMLLPTPTGMMLQCPVQAPTLHAYTCFRFSIKSGYFNVAAK